VVSEEKAPESTTIDVFTHQERVVRGVPPCAERTRGMRRERGHSLHVHLESAFVQRICDPESCLTERVEFRFEIELFLGGRTEEDSDDAGHWNVVTRSRCAAFTLVDEHALCIDVDGICDRCGFSSIEFSLEFGTEIGWLRRDDSYSAPITKRFDAVTPIGARSEFVPDCRRNNHVLELGFDQVKSFDECEVQQR